MCSLRYFHVHLHWQAEVLITISSQKSITYGIRTYNIWSITYNTWNKEPKNSYKPQYPQGTSTDQEEQFTHFNWF